MIMDVITPKQELTETLTGLKSKPNLQELLNGIKAQGRIDRLLVILLDRSGSMSSAIDTVSKIDTAWQLFKTQLMSNMAGWDYGIILFGDDAYWSILPCNNTSILVKMDTPMAMGMTTMGKALNIAWGYVRQNVKQARFIMLTDGMPNDMSKGQILDMAKENKSIPIDTVGIGKGVSDYDPMFLAELSSITGGVFVEAKTAKLLADTIKRLSPMERPLLGPVKE